MKAGKLIISLTLATGIAGAVTAAAQTTIKLATVVPENSKWVAVMRKNIVDIEKRTDDRVKFKLYTGGIQGNSNQVLRKMRIGQINGGAFTSGSLRPFSPDAEIYGLPMEFRDYQEVNFVRQHLDAELRQRMEDNGYVNFGFAGGGFAYLMAPKPIASLADMKGIKIWIPEGNDIAANASRALGISPVTLPLTDVLTGLQTDLIDTVMGPPVGAIVMQWNTVVKYITDVPIAYVYATLVIDKKVFNRLSAGDQAIVREVMNSVYRGFDEESQAVDKSSMQALLDDGLKLVPVSQDQQEEWHEQVSAANRKLADQGAFDATLLDRMNCYLKAYRAGSDGSQCGH